jgi:hypothetical protein
MPEPSAEGDNAGSLAGSAGAGDDNCAAPLTALVSDVSIVDDVAAAGGGGGGSGTDILAGWTAGSGAGGGSAGGRSPSHCNIFFRSSLKNRTPLAHDPILAPRTVKVLGGVIDPSDFCSLPIEL